MKKLALIVLGCVIAAPVLLADSKEKEEIAQKTCPVSGKPIDSDKSVEYEGEKIYFCCGGCPKAFDKEPMKFLPAVYKQKYPQRIQTACPMSGKPFKDSVSADLNGQVVRFCCNGCKSDAESDPDAALKKFAKVSTDQVHCPFSGKAVKASATAEFKGRTILFCCENCSGKFADEPAKFADKIAVEVGVLARGPEAKDDIVLAATCEGGVETVKRSAAESVVHHGKRYFATTADCAKKIDNHGHQHVDAIMKALKAQEKN